MKRIIFLLVLGASVPDLALSRSFPSFRLPADDRFGVMTHFAHGWETKWISSAVDASVFQVRDELYWASIERERGVFSFPAEYDAYMAALNANGISPLVVLAFENPLYDQGDTPHTEEAIAAFARYAVEVVRHYGRQIKAVEVWNEFNGSFAHGPATEDRAGAYLRLLRATYTAIKRERPDVTVVGGATAGVPLPYWKKLLEGGALGSLDAVSIHPYRYDQTPEGIEQQVAELRALMQASSAGNLPPIWATEIGWFTKESDAVGDLAIDERVQAQFLVRAYVLLLSAQVERIYWYLLHDYQGLGMGLFQENEKNRVTKPAARAYAALVEELRGARFVRRETTRSDFYAMTFTNGTEDVRVVWSLTPTAIGTREVTCAVDCLGQVLPPADQLQITESPVFLRGKVADLPPAATQPVVIADATRDFSPTQGRSGWSYGALPRGEVTLRLLPDFSSSDWNAGWSGLYPFLSVTAGDQHPSCEGQTPVSAVRRWQSPAEGPVRVSGSFRCGTSGDGVGVSISVDGQPRWRKLLGGDRNNAITEKFDFVENVHPGTVIDFAVDPGPAASIDFDATAVTVAITKEAP
jgi:hypothetical protein